MLCTLKRVLYLLASNPRDDPSQHRGRVRKQPHVENSWATYVYLEGMFKYWEWLKRYIGGSIGYGERSKCLFGIIVPVENEIQRVINHITDYDNVYPIIEDQKEKRLHISLSRCIYLQHHQLEPFVQSIRDHVKSSK